MSPGRLSVSSIVRNANMLSNAAFGQRVELKSLKSRIESVLLFSTEGVICHIKRARIGKDHAA